MKTAKKKLREQDAGELGSPLASLRGDLGQRQSDTESAISRMKAKVRTILEFNQSIYSMCLVLCYSQGLLI